MKIETGSHISINIYFISSNTFFFVTVLVNHNNCGQYTLMQHGVRTAYSMLNSQRALRTLSSVYISSNVTMLIYEPYVVPLWQLT